MIEEWKIIDGFPNYKINTSGLIVNIKRNHPLTLRKHMGYWKCALRAKGKQKSIFVHRLLAGAFIPNPNNYPFINHKDGIKGNNTLSNLEWCTRKQNAEHAGRMGLTRYLYGEDHPKAKLTGNDVDSIRKNYVRYGKTNTHTLAKVYGVSPRLISKIILGQIWKDQVHDIIKQAKGK